MSKQNKHNQALIKAVEVAARIDPSLFRVEYPTRYCEEFKQTKNRIGQICTRELGHNGPHITVETDYDENGNYAVYKIYGKPWLK